MNWRCFFRRADRDTESERDIQFYLETETSENIERGFHANKRRPTGNLETPL